MKTKAKYKQRPLEKIQNQTVQERIAKLEKALADSEYEKTILSRRLEARSADVEEYKNGWAKALPAQNRYKFLKNCELMVLGKNGAQYVTGEALDEYCDTQIKIMHDRMFLQHGSSLVSPPLAQINEHLNNAYRNAIESENRGLFLTNARHLWEKK